MQKETYKQSFEEFIDGKIDPFVIECIGLTEEMRKYRKLQPLADQLIRSATSIGANVHESRGCDSRKEHARYFEHSRKSACETTYWLYLVMKVEKKLLLKTHGLHKQSIEIEKILSKSITSLRNSKKTSNN